MSKENQCDHKWVYFDTKKKYESSAYQTYFKRIDYFYCEKCLNTNEIVRDGYSRETPDWY